VRCALCIRCASIVDAFICHVVYGVLKYKKCTVGINVIYQILLCLEKKSTDELMFKILFYQLVWLVLLKRIGALNNITMHHGRCVLTNVVHILVLHVALAKKVNFNIQ